MHRVSPLVAPLHRLRRPLLDGDTREGPWICIGMAAAQHDQFEGTGAQRMDESGAPSARNPGLGFEVAPTQGPPIKGTAAEDA